MVVIAFLLPSLSLKFPSTLSPKATRLKPLDCWAGDRVGGEGEYRGALYQPDKKPWSFY